MSLFQPWLHLSDCQKVFDESNLWFKTLFFEPTITPTYFVDLDAIEADNFDLGLTLCNKVLRTHDVDVVKVNIYTFFCSIITNLW